MRPVVSVMGSSGAASAVRHLAAGQQLRFGACRCGRCALDLVLPAEQVTGRIRAYLDHWRLDNLGAVPMTVTDLEHSFHQLSVPSGRTEVVVPFELARIYIGDRPLATVFGPEPTVQPLAKPCPAVRPAPPAGVLDRHTTYFAVLLALCEPRLRALAGDGSAPAALPTSAEIARDLRRRGRAVTTMAVDRHIDYLIGKLGLRPRDPMARARRSWRKEALVAAALRRGLVGPEHLTARSPATVNRVAGHSA